MKKYTILFLALLGCMFSLSAQSTVEFPSADGLAITADLYEADADGQVILLCHQATFSRGEYVETAKQLQEYGYNCLAMDQRSGKEANGIANETAKRAAAAGKATTYLDAEQDIVAAIDWLHEKYNKQVIIVGSSYSASLVLKIARVNPKVKAVAAFSPGEYFGNTVNITRRIGGMEKPVFVTSSKSEAAAVTQLVFKIDAAHVAQYIPETEGYHGSRALWSDNEGHEGYWAAFLEFLGSLSF